MQFVVDHLRSLDETELNSSALKRQWSSLMQSIYTLFLCISSGVDWKEVADPLMKIAPLLGFVFCLYMAFSVFCVLNIVTGVFVENAVTMTAMDEQQMLLQEMSERRKWI